MKLLTIPCKSLRLLTLLFIVLSILPQAAKASHYMGGEITVTYVTGNTYRITQKIYRDCAGVTLGTTTIVNVTSSLGNTSYTLNRTSVVDRTVLCPGQVSRCASTAGVQGTEEHIYSAVVTLVPNVTYTISSTLTARNNSITTLTSPGSQDMFLSTVFRTEANNSSPQFLNLPIGTFCINQLASLSPNGFDPDGDALVFSLVNARRSAVNPVQYAAGFSGLNPLTSSSPITINPNTGLLSFTPTVANQIPVICVRIEEYRNGLKIGEITRDVQLRMVSCASNSAPALSALPSVVVPVGQQYCVNVAATDADNNAITLTATSGIIPPATFTLGTSGAGFANGTFCFTPTLAQQGNTYSVSINAIDNACPQPASTVRTFNVTVPAPCNVTINASATPAACGASDGTATASLSGGVGPYQYQWSGGAAPSTQTSLTGLAAGTYCVTIVDGNSCVGETCVTVTGGSSSVQLTADVVNNTCALANGSITLSATGGVAPYNFSINGGAAQASGLFENLPAGTYATAVTDASGCGATTGTATLLDIADVTPPTANCLNVTLQLDAYGNAATTAEEVNNNSSDECGAVTLRLSQTDFDCSHLGNNTVTLYVTDGNGNQSTCQATVTVEDNLDPDIHCKPATLVLDATGNATLTTADVRDHDHENCTVVSLTLSKTAFNCSNLGPNYVDLTAVDNSGNTSTCQTLVTVVDNEAPVANCQNVTAVLVGSEATVTAAEINNGSTDNCGIASLTLDNTTFSCAELGANTVTLTVADYSGNATTCQATVTVVDNTAPVANCKNVTAVLNGNTVSVTATDVDSESSDNCGVASVSIDNGTFTCANLGANTVTLTATDASGNSSTCQATVTVVDNEAPVAVCQNVTVTLNGGTATVTAAQVDNGSSDNCTIASLSLSNTEFTCANIGNNTVTLTVTDQSGNSSTCDATVTVVGSIPVVSITVNPSPAVLNGLPNTIYRGYGPQSLTLTGTGASTYVWAASASLSCTNCTATNASPTATTAYTVTGTNEYGCTASATKTICVIDARDFDKKGNPNGKVLICHIPPGNPANSHTLSVSANAIPAHLAHGDVLGACGAVCGSAKTDEDGGAEAMIINGEETNELQVNVYPNPSANQFQAKVAGNSNEEIDIRIFDVLGQLIDIKTGLANQTEYTFGSNLTAGIYMVEVKQGESKQLVRVIKSN
ncbi:MAG TPA: T9SS type A sorting domain-containing protein [Chitinophagales bacterium]|nr:T9SS type A sorting domain-containing protein [Chitinophagales bacterium]